MFIYYINEIFIKINFICLLAFLQKIIMNSNFTVEYNLFIKEELEDFNKSDYDKESSNKEDDE